MHARTQRTKTVCCWRWRENEASVANDDTSQRSVLRSVLHETTGMLAVVLGRGPAVEVLAKLVISAAKSCVWLHFLKRFG